MNKRLALIAGVVILIAMIILVIFKRNTLPIQIKAGKVTSLSSLSALAAGLEKKGNLSEAKLAYQKLINEFPGCNEVINWQKKIEDLNMKLLFCPTITPGSILYEVKPGDSLTKIAKGQKTTVGLIIKSNHLANDKILPGSKIKVWANPFSIVVDKSQNTLILKTDDEIIKTYIVSTGTNNSTPTGTFKIINKQTDPTWFKAGTVIPAGSPNNLLGSRWLGLDLSGYGIHGTVEPQSLGKQVTQGCVRMANADVEELYDIIPMGTEVTIID